MKFNTTDVAGILLDFGTPCIIGGQEVLGVYEKDYITDLDTTTVQHTLFLGDTLLQAYRDIGSTVVIPEYSFTGTVKDYQIETSGFVMLELRKS